MVIAVDLGTTYAKLGFFKGNELVKVRQGVTLSQLGDYINDQGVERVIISSVSYNHEQLKNIMERPEKAVFLTNKLSLPIKTDYETPETLGADRLAAAAGAYNLFPGMDCLIIDAGTCITVDLLDKTGTFCGGSISPGINLKFKALHNYTTNLPLVITEDVVELPGKSTKGSILAGVVLGTQAEIREIVRLYRNKFPILQLVICGGDAEQVKKGLNSDVAVVPELVLWGLKTILDYHVKKEN